MSEKRYKEVEVQMTLTLPVEVRLRCKWDTEEELVQLVAAALA